MLNNEEFWKEQKRLAEESLKESIKAFRRAIVALIISGVASIGAIVCVLIKIFIS